MNTVNWKISIETFKELIAYFKLYPRKLFKQTSNYYSCKNICEDFHYQIPKICDYIYKTLTIENFRNLEMEENFRVNIRGALDYTPLVKGDYPTIQPKEINCDELQPGFCNFLYKSDDYMPLFITGTLMMHRYNILITSFKVFSCARNKMIINVSDRWDEEDVYL